MIAQPHSQPVKRERTIFMIDKLALQKTAEIILNDYLNVSGSILYSSYETIKPGKLYFLGFNPGGVPEENGFDIRESINGMINNTTNAFLDEPWSYRKKPMPAGKAPLQERICWVLKRFGVTPRDVCASNLIFVRSISQDNLNYNWFDLASTCWEFHKKMLNIINPKIILCCGNGKSSSYGYIKVKCKGIDEHVYPSGDKNKNLKNFYCNIDGRDVVVAGMPHLSRYSPVSDLFISGKPEFNSWVDLLRMNY